MRAFLLLLLLKTTLAFGSKNDSHNFEIREVNQKNLVAKLYLPSHSVDVPVVIVIGGSSGGMRTERGELLAKNGIAALTLAYFRYKELPQTLDNIPVESVLNAINFLETTDVVDASKIGIWGASRGSELAFLAASNDSRIKSLAVTTPSKVAWHGMTTPTAWTYQQQKISSLTFDRTGSSPMIERSVKALKSPDKVSAAQFKFERINGPVLLISAENDHIWPSFQMANDIEEYLSRHKYQYSVKHDSYPTGHFFDEKTLPVIYKSVTEHFNKTLRR